MSKTRSLVAVTALVGVAALSGCGVTDTAWSPGVAAQVGSTTISLARVDDVANGYCEFISEQLEAQGQTVPMSYLRSGVAGQIALVSAAEQVAAAYGVDSGENYAGQLAQLEPAVADYPQHVQDAVIEVESASAYLTDVLIGIGSAELARSGEPASAAEAAIGAGEAVVSDWIAEQDISFDPRFGIRLDSMQLTNVDQLVSVPVGATAVAGAATEPDATFSANLPENQRCG